MLYTGINEVSGWLRTLQNGLDTTFAGAPEPLRLHVQNAMLSLHELVEAMTDKLPRGETLPEQLAKPEPVTAMQAHAVLDDLHRVLANPATMLPEAPKSEAYLNARKRAAQVLLKRGILHGLQLLSYRRTPEANVFIGLNGTTKAAALRLFDEWKIERERMEELNRHDAQELQEIRIDTQEQAHKAHEYINNIG